MNLILLLVIGFLVFIGTYMILSLNLIRIVIGISIYTHGKSNYYEYGSL